jgi:hypothetical protein
MRSSSDPLGARLRLLLTERGVDPARSLLAEFFQDDGELYLGIVVTQDRRAIHSDFDFLRRSVDEGTFSRWEDITDSPTSPYSGVVEATLFRLERESGAIL